jgi:hypothetical protein
LEFFAAALKFFKLDPIPQALKKMFAASALQTAASCG